MDIVGLSIRRPIFIVMVTAFLIVIGALALRKLPVDLYPDVTYPVLAVRADLGGAAPEEMEQLVTRRLEDALSSLAGLKTMRSQSREGSSTVVLEFETGVDVKFQEIQVRAKVANMRRSLPDDLSEPVVYRQDPDDTPIIEVAVTGSRTAAELTEIADLGIADRLRQVEGVGEVGLSGSRKPEVRVDLRPEALEAWRLTAADVAAAIRRFSGNDPIGKLTGKDRQWLLRSVSHVKGVADLNAVPVGRDASGKAVLLSDVATVTQGFQEVSRVSRLNLAGELRPAIVIEVSKQSGGNTVAVSDQVRAALDQLRADLPADVQFLITRDNADLVRSNVADVVETLVIGAFLTVVVVLLFLRSPRATLTTALSLPSSVITTFAVMAVAGFTINVMTLLALSLAIGLLVDDAIVVRENIFRHLNTGTGKGKGEAASPKVAAASGAREVTLAVIATTLTLVAVFLPVGFMGGTTGQFFKQFALTVVFAVMVSLWDALTMAPMLSAYFANVADPAKEWASFGRIGRAFDAVLIRFEHVFTSLEARYHRVLGWMLPRPWVALLATVVALVAAGAGFSLIGKSFLPAQLGQVFSVQLGGPLAMPVPRVVEVADEVDGRMRKVKGLESWTISAGQGWGGSASVNLTVRVAKDFSNDQEELAGVRTETRAALDGIPGYTVRVSEPSDPLAGSTGRFQPVAVQISGDELDQLKDIARQVQALMNDLKGVTDVGQVQDDGLPELRLTTLPALAGHYGVSPETLATEMRAWVEGDTSNTLQLGNERIPIRVKLAGGDQLSAESLMAKSLFVKPSGSGASIPVAVGEVVSWDAGAGPAVIGRENRQKVLRIGANLQRGAALGDVVKELEERLREIPLPSGYRAKIVGQSEQLDELFSSVVLAIGLGCLFMYMILASLFESFAQPLTVMAAVPLAATGAVAALLLFGMPLDLYGGIGMILLAGIVAKNSILLVDFASKAVRDHGAAPRDAILASAPRRLRPILMTSVAMIAGMLPVAAGLGSGGAARQSLGVATIGGIISSTLLTLLVVPNLYVSVERLARRVLRRPVA
jgi:HAE1 family hydrophobic/amphiphilic exporter-1